MTPAPNDNLRSPGHQLDTWCVVGSSPSSASFQAAAMHLLGPMALWITTNGAWNGPKGNLLAAPDYYFLSDIQACQQYRQTKDEFAFWGAKIVTLARVPSALEARGLADAHEFLHVDPSISPPGYRAGHVTGISFSGLYCLQFAMQRLPRRVVMIGMEGYDTKQTPQGSAGDVTQTIIGPFTNKVIWDHPETRFILCGTPRWEVEPNHHNLTWCESTGALELALTP